MNEKIPKKQCAMLVYGVERAHKSTAMINAVGVGGALIFLLVEPLAAAVVLLAVLGYDVYIAKKQDQKMKYLRDKYGLE